MSLRGILNDDLAGTANTSATSRSPSLGLSTTMTTNGQHQDEREPEEAAVGNGVEDLSSLVPDSRQRDSGIIDLSSDNEADSDINVCPPAASRGRTASGVSPNPKTSRQPFSASASTNAPPVQHNVVPSQAPCVPKKRKAAPMSIDISDDEGASSTSSSRVARQQPQASTSATTTAPATPSSSQASAIARQKEEDPDSDLEITHHSQHRAPAPTATMSQQQRQQQQQSAPHSLHPDVAVDNRPLLMGQITTVALIVAALPEICTKQPAGSPALPPVPVILYRDDPRLAQTKPDYSERTQLLTLQGVRFGTLETRLSDVLGPVLDGAPCKAHHVRFQATVQRAPPDGPCTAILPLHILVFSTPQFYKALSDHLSSKAVFLDHPSVPYNGHERYFNPHNPGVRLEQEQRRYAMQHRSRYGAGAYGSSSSFGVGRFQSQQQNGLSEDAKREQVEAVFATMNSGADLGTVEPNTAVIKSPLYGHQKQALAFLLDREKVKGMPDREQEPDNQYVGLWRLERADTLRWVNVVTELFQAFSELRPVLPPQCRGAILADDMGLGKTIVIISLVAQTLQEAAEFEKDVGHLGQSETGPTFDAIHLHPISKQKDTFSFQTIGSSSQTKKKDKGPGKRELAREEAEDRRRARLTRRSRATLIICPLSTVQNWEQQIIEHTADKSIKVYIYHGSGRTSSAAALANNDVVITTYSTLGAEYSKMARAEDLEDEGSSEGNESEVEVVSSFGGIGLQVEQQPSKKKKPQKAAKRKPAKAADGTVYTSPLQQVEWFRVVLDEAHMIKEHSTIQAKAACDLSAQRRIGLTGTPLQNNLNDLFSLCRFIRLEPFTDKHVWTHYIGTPAKSGDKLAVSRLQLLTRHIALRRTKDTQTNQGKPILTLPPKKDEIIYLELDEQEKAFYSSHHHRYKSDFLQNAQSDSLLLKNYASILQELLRLRQICCHLALVRDSQDASNADDDIAEHIKKLGISKPRATKLLNIYRDSGAVVCCECNYAFSNKSNAEIDGDLEVCSQKKAGKRKAQQGSSAAKGSGCSDDTLGPMLLITRCGHVFCIACFIKNVSPSYPQCEAAERAACSQCKSEMTPAVDVIDFTPQELAENDAAALVAEANASKAHQVEHSTKIRVLMRDLLPFSQANPSSANFIPGFGVPDAEYDSLSKDDVDKPRQGDSVKSVVFSQWTKLLDRIADGLDECHIQYGRLDGTMTRDARTKAMESFKSDPACEVLLVSLRAGGVGLNLTMASRVYLMEPFWNPAVENQATDRIHRLGQQRAVKLTRYIVKDSIEANMMEIQKRKMEMANLSLGQTLPKAELAARRIENLKILFG